MGLEGPYADWVGFGANFESLCGLTGLRGYADEDPTSLTSVFHMDPASAATAAFALLAVLRRRDGIDGTGGTGRGELIEFSQSENVMQHIGEYFIDAAASRTRHQPVGNRSIARAPQGCYRCAVDPARPDHDDEWAVIACETDDDWQSLARLIDQDLADTAAPLADDDRLATLSGRLEHHADIDTRISAWTATRTSAEVFHRCQQAGVPAGPVLRESQLRADPQMGDRAWFRENGSVEQGWHSFPGRQWRWDGPEMPWRAHRHPRRRQRVRVPRSAGPRRGRMGRRCATRAISPATTSTPTARRCSRAARARAAPRAQRTRAGSADAP